MWGSIKGLWNFKAHGNTKGRYEGAEGEIVRTNVLLPAFGTGRPQNKLAFVLDNVTYTFITMLYFMI